VAILDQTLSSEFSTYSLVVPGAKYDESRHIRDVGAATRTRQYFTAIRPEEFLTELEDFIVAQEEPVTGVSPYAQYKVMQLAHKHGAKVLLDGQGGDEVFAGYVYYFAYYYYELLRSLRVGALLKEMVLCMRYFRNVFPHMMLGFMLLPKRLQSALWGASAKRWLNHRMLAALGCRGADPRWRTMNLQEAQQLTLTTTAIPHLLRWEDKNSMRWSVESRVPFLDVRLVEAGYSLPSEAKLHDGRTKVLFRDAMKSIVPTTILQRKDKVGFAAPSDDLFRNPGVVAFARGILESASFGSRPYWRRPRVLKVFEDHVDGGTNAGDTIWRWINVELWLRAFFPNPVTAHDATPQQS
jgi:asparagine synthase (glutamine-hydrolysing)